MREQLAGLQPGGVTLQVDDEDFYKEGDWWCVPIRPSRWPKRMADFYEALAEVEDDIQERENLNILLATGHPLEEDAEALAA